MNGFGIGSVMNGSDILVTCLFNDIIYVLFTESMTVAITAMKNIAVSMNSVSNLSSFDSNSKRDYLGEELKCKDVELSYSKEYFYYREKIV